MVYPTDVAMIFPTSPNPRKYDIPNRPPISTEEILAGETWQKISWQRGVRERSGAALPRDASASQTVIGTEFSTRASPECPAMKCGLLASAGFIHSQEQHFQAEVTGRGRSRDNPPVFARQEPSYLGASSPRIYPQ